MAVFCRFWVLANSSETGWWRPEPESNRRARICSPLRNHSAIGPWLGRGFPRAWLGRQARPDRVVAPSPLNSGHLPPMFRSMAVGGRVRCRYEQPFDAACGVAQDMLELKVY